MPQERNNFDRKIFKLGALISGPFLLAACQGTTTEQKTPLGQASTTTGQQLATQEPSILPPNTKTPQRLTSPTPFSEQFGENNQPINPNTNKDSQNPQSFEPYFDEFGALINKVMKNNYLYTYALIPQTNPQIGIPNAKGFISDPKLNAYIPDPEKRTRIINLYQQALDKDIANPNDPEIPQLILDASLVLKDVCTTGFHKIIMEGNASMIYSKNPKFWQDNQFALLDSNCYWGEKFNVSQ